MAKIVLSEEAPQGEPVTFSLGSAEPFEAPYETSDPSLLANAAAHPWLTVEYDEQAISEGQFREPHVPYEEDALAAHNSVANDPDAVRAALEEETNDSPLAVDAGRDQSKPEYVGNVGVTLAADDSDDHEEDEN